MKHLSALEKAIEYIETHLDENIGLDDVSRETGYSYYHMTRLFSSVLGESVGRYINRRSAEHLKLILELVRQITERQDLIWYQMPRKSWNPKMCTISLITFPTIPN